MTDNLSQANVSEETVAIIKSSLGSGSVTITLSPAVTQVIINSVANVFAAPSLQISTAIASLSLNASNAVQTLIAASSLPPELATTIVPTALNDALAAINAELSILVENASPELKALAAQLDEIRKASLPSLEVP